MRFDYKVFFSAAATLLLVSLSASSGATVVAYSDTTSFAAATSASATDSFDDLVAGNPALSGGYVAAPLARTAGAYMYTANLTGGIVQSTHDFYPVDNGAGDVSLTSNFPEDTLVLSGFSPSVRAIGGLFFGSDIDGAFLPGQSFNFSLITASGTVTSLLSSSGVTSFFGFVSTDAITSLSITAVQSGQGLNWHALNDLVLAQDAAPVGQQLPEPGSLLLVIAGLAACGYSATQRKLT